MNRQAILMTPDLATNSGSANARPGFHKHTRYFFYRPTGKDRKRTWTTKKWSEVRVAHLQFRANRIDLKPRRCVFEGSVSEDGDVTHIQLQLPVRVQRHKRHLNRSFLSSAQLGQRNFERKTEVLPRYVCDGLEQKRSIFTSLHSFGGGRCNLLRTMDSHLLNDDTVEAVEEQVVALYAAVGYWNREVRDRQRMPHETLQD